MAADPATVDRALTARFLRDHPVEAARSVEQLPPESAGEMLAVHPVGVLTALFDHLSPFVAARMIDAVPAQSATQILAAMQPAAAAAALAQMDDERRDAWLASLNPAIAGELRSLLEYPPDSAGRLMSRRLGFFGPDMSVPEASQRLRELAVQDARTLFLVDGEGRLAGRVSTQRLATAPTDATLADLAEPAPDRVDAIALRDELVDMLTRTGLTDIPLGELPGSPARHRARVGAAGGRPTRRGRRSPGHGRR